MNLSIARGRGKKKLFWDSHSKMGAQTQQELSFGRQLMKDGRTFGCLVSLKPNSVR